MILPKRYKILMIGTKVQAKYNTSIKIFLTTILYKLSVNDN